MKLLRGEREIAERGTLRIRSLRYQWLKAAQDSCPEFQQRLRQHAAHSLRSIGDIDLIVHTDVETRKHDIDCVKDVIVWLHRLLGKQGTSQDWDAPLLSSAIVLANQSRAHLFCLESLTLHFGASFLLSL